MRYSKNWQYTTAFSIFFTTILIKFRFWCSKYAAISPALFTLSLSQHDLNIPQMFPSRKDFKNKKCTSFECFFLLARIEVCLSEFIQHVKNMITGGEFYLQKSFQGKHLQPWKSFNEKSAENAIEKSAQVISFLQLQSQM